MKKAKYVQELENDKFLAQSNDIGPYQNASQRLNMQRRHDNIKHTTMPED